MFSEFTIAHKRIRNRIAMVAMATNLADINGGVTQAMIDYYAERAKGGAGLIIVENSGVDPAGRNGAVQLRCDVLSNVPGLGRLADAIHYFGAAAIIQLQHAGQATRREYTGQLPVGPSPLLAEDGSLISRELSQQEIAQLVDKFAQAAAYAQMAGLDGVEIHAAHAYLLAEFISPLANHRCDDYGGSLENRARFITDIIKAVRKRTGRDFIISVRLNGQEMEMGGLSTQEATRLALLLQQAGADLLNVSSGFKRHAECLSAFAPQGWRVPLSAAIKQAVSIPVLTSGGLRRRAMMEDVICSGQADLIGVGRQFIADPHWPRKMSSGSEDAIAHCLMCNVGCAGNRISGKRSIQCTVNPDVGREGAAVFASLPTPRPRRIAVIGAGPAGVTLATEAAARGHQVHVWEKRSQANGAMRLAASVPGKDGLRDFCRHMQWLADNSKLSIEYNSEATADKVLAFKPDIAVYCGGLLPHRLEQILDYDSGKVQTAHEFLETDKHEHENEDAIIIGGGSVGCEVADRLAGDNNRVTIIEMLPHICSGTHEINRKALLDRLAEQNVTIMVNTKLVSMEQGAIIINQNNTLRSMRADLFIVAAGGRGIQPKWFDSLKAKGIECYAIGEGAAAKPSNIMQAIQEGTALGRTL